MANKVQMSLTTWTPLACLSTEDDETLALLVLNRPLEKQMKMLEILWRKAVFKACVDGGTNRLYDNLGDRRGQYIPNIVTGDFDSARKEVLEYYKSKDSEIIGTPDQDYTDFTKCIKIVLERIAQKQIHASKIVVIGAFDGRLDQVFANINTLFEAKTLQPDLQVYLMSEESVACLLSEGKHVINVETGLEGDWNGLIPVGEPCHCVTTTGLKWNLDKQGLKFGDLISTSNTWNGKASVTIETDRPLLWTMGINLDRLQS